jgi:REP element-mobilizing transposase RayT
MKTPVLIVTPDPKLGELISNSLAETFQFDAHCFREPQAALDFLHTLRNCEHLLIETTLGEQGVLEVGRAARSLKHNIKLVLVSRTKPPASFDELRPWRLLRQPFLLPDLFSVLDAAPPTVIDVKAAAPRKAPKPNWLDDRALAASTLERLAVDTSAQQVLILRENDLWASTGQLNNSAVSEIMKMVLGSMDSGDQFDLLRFMRLTSQKVQHGVWARLLMVNVILAAIYDADASINEMRTETNALAEALSRPLLARPPESDHPALTSGRTVANPPPRPRSKVALIDSPRPAPRTEPPPDWNHLRVHPAGTGELGEDFGDGSVLSDERDLGLRYPRTMPPDSEPLETEPSTPADARDRRGVREPGPFDQYSVSYSCLLTPRFDTHSLRGDLKDLLQTKLRQICISYGWGLGLVEVLSDCLHWVVMVPPTETVADHIQMVRRMTSACVFEDYPEYAQENLSRDFWAPGSSLLTGPQRHTPAQIQAYARSRHQRFGGNDPGRRPDGLLGSPSVTGGD